MTKYMKPDDYNTKIKPNFCPGCGDFGIWNSFKNAAASQGWDSSNAALVAGIGCHGHILNFTKINSIEGLHGRPIPVATGIKLANNNLNVFVFTGDGDCWGEGGNHFIHACRRNHDITIFIHDNAIYGLTTGQTSPRTEHGAKTKSTPLGNKDIPLNPIATAIAAGATFVARAFSMQGEKLTELMIEANKHKGVAIIDILQTCITFNKEYTMDFYRDNVYELPESYDPTDKQAAFAKSLEWGEKKIPLGVIYKNEKQPSYEAQIGWIQGKPVTSIEPSVKDVSAMFEHHM
jgi:2-oxoglutarate/2-oxoacid ferredoxin oxidoreductase subunit beta